MTTAGREVEAYLDRLPPEQRTTLEDLRRTIQAVLPDAVEVMSYGVPTFKHAKAVVSYGAAKNHCALYVMSTAAAQPLPDALVTKLVRARVAENAAAEQAAMERRRARGQNPQKDAPQ